jgi:hypothetical protein
MLAVFPALGIWDAVAYELGGDDATFSRICYLIAQKYPLYLVLVCELFGILAGHVFTTRLGEQPIVNRWITLTLFVFIPYGIVVAAAIFELNTLHAATAPLKSFHHNHPGVAVPLWLVAGSQIGSRLLFQSGP